MDWSEMAAANLDEFGEDATYRKASGATRAIRIIPNRNPAVPNTQQPGTLAPKVSFFCLNSATTGISAAELQLQSDEILFPERVGGATSRAWQISKPLQQDATGLVLEVD